MHCAWDTDEIKIYTRSFTMGDFGPSPVTWTLTQTLYGRYVPLSDIARLEYQKRGTDPVGKIVIQGPVEGITFRNSRFEVLGLLLEPEGGAFPSRALQAKRS